MPAVERLLVAGAALAVACAPDAAPPGRPVIVVLVERDRFAFSAAPRTGAQLLEFRDVSGQAHRLTIAGRELALAANAIHRLELNLSEGDHLLACTTHGAQRVVSVSSSP